jgi:hypothetical protein
VPKYDLKNFLLYFSWKAGKYAKITWALGGGGGFNLRKAESGGKYHALSWQPVTGGQMHILEVGTMTESGCYTSGTESLILTVFFSSGQTCECTLYVFLQLFMFTCILLYIACTVFRKCILWQMRGILLL